MHQHGQKTITGPIIGSQGWWQGVVGTATEPCPGDHRKKSPKNELAKIPGIRGELVARIRQEIAAGTYDTPEKWDQALEKLLARVI